MTEPAFSFRTAQAIRFGRGTAPEATAWAASRARRVVLLHGADPGRAAWLHESLAGAGIAVAGFSCPKEPDTALIEAGVDLARAHHAQAVLALGGGAVIDAGKAIAALAPGPRPILDHLEVVGAGLPLEAAPLPFAALPTTAGTGAEVTRNAVIRVPEHRRKVSLRDDRMLPDLALVDPALTDGLPWMITLASGLDAVTQVIEPFVSARANRMTDALCRDAIPLSLSALRRLAEGEQPAARDDLAWVSLCGGLALANAGLGAVHGLAGVIGGIAATAPHGAICGALLPHVLAANARRAEGETAARFGTVANWIGGSLGAGAGTAFQTLAEWSRAQGLPRLGEMGVTRDALAEIAEAAQASSSMKGNPARLSQAELTGILEKAL